MSRFARTSAAAALIVALSPAAFAQDTATPAPAPETAAPSEMTADTVLAVVDGVEITLGNVISVVRDLPEQYKQLPDDVLFDGILEQVIQQTVLSKAFSNPTRAETMALENQQRAMEAGLVVERILAEPVTDEELQAAYDKKFDGVEPDKEYNASHILVETEDEAKAIVEELKNGGDFEAIAKDKSKDPGSGANGGKLGWFGLGMMVPEFEQAVVALPVGEVSEPVQSQFGWHVIKVNETRLKDKPSLADMHDQLIDEIKNAKVEAAIADATEKADIVRKTDGIDPSVLRKTELLDK